MIKSVSGGVGLGLAVCILLWPGGPAQAALVSYSFSGTVTQAAYGPQYGTPLGPDLVVVGQVIPVTFTLDTSFPDSNPSPTVGFYTNSPAITPTPVPAASFNGDSPLGLFSTVTVDVGSSVTIDSGSPLTGAGFQISFTGAHAGVLATDAVPTTLNPADFSSVTFQRVLLFSVNDTGFSGTLGPAATPVPAPASLPLLVSGLAGLWATCRRRRA